MIPVWLWQADGAASGGRGVCGDHPAAREAAEKRLLSGDATEAVVEQATTDLDLRTLLDGYHRTGGKWQARVGAGGGVWWVPVKPDAGLTAPNDFRAALGPSSRRRSTAGDRRNNRTERPPS